MQLVIGGGKTTRCAGCSDCVSGFILASFYGRRMKFQWKRRHLHYCPQDTILFLVKSIRYNIVSCEVHKKQSRILKRGYTILLFVTYHVLCTWYRVPCSVLCTAYLVPSTVYCVLPNAQRTCHSYLPYYVPGNVYSEYHVLCVPCTMYCIPLDA